MIQLRSMKRALFIFIPVLGILAGVYMIAAVQRNYNIPEPAVIDIFNRISPAEKPTDTPVPTPTEIVAVPEISAVIPIRIHAFQSFNNCGPASLSMLISYFDVSVSQAELGNRLRPFQNPQGDNDDKSVTLGEMAEESKNYGLIPYHRPSGNLSMIKKFIANGIPVAVRTWLHLGEDIGHYRVVRGYDDATGEIIQDDSYEGKDLRFSYDTFLALWQPFNYEYLIVVPEDKKEIAEHILGENLDEHSAWQNTFHSASEEKTKNPDDIYPVFNKSIALFYLGRYEESAAAFESVQNRLPARMLWYQTEPAETYLKLKKYDALFRLTENMLVYNRAFSEVYLMRGAAYKQQGNLVAAEQEFQKAILYNSGDQMRKKVEAINVPAESGEAQP